MLSNLCAGRVTVYVLFDSIAYSTFTEYLCLFKGSLLFLLLIGTFISIVLKPYSKTFIPLLLYPPFRRSLLERGPRGELEKNGGGQDEVFLDIIWDSSYINEKG